MGRKGLLQLLFVMEPVMLEGTCTHPCEGLAEERISLLLSKGDIFLQIARTQSTMHVTERQNVQRSLSLSFHSLFTWLWDIHHNTINHQRSPPQELFSRSSKLLAWQLLKSMGLQKCQWLFKKESLVNVILHIQEHAERPPGRPVLQHQEEGLTRGAVYEPSFSKPCF